MPIKKRNKKESKIDYLEELFEVANDTRKFEIELFWKRATFFVLIIGALFIGYAKFYENDQTLCSLIALFGLISSIVWTFSIMGSKFWQENWEAIIKSLANNGSKKALLFQQKFGYVKSNYAQQFSVSKSVFILSILIIIGWWFLLFFSISDEVMLKILGILFIFFLFFFCIKSFLISGKRKEIILFNKINQKTINKNKLDEFNKKMFD